MAKLELDLKHGLNVVGSTSIDINGAPQFSLKYYSARPNKIPIPMNTVAQASEGGLDYIGPLQPRAGFLSGNVYTVEVTVLNAPVGTIVGLSTRELKTLTGAAPGVVQGVIVTPINGGATNASRVAEFQVNFSTYPGASSNVSWYGFMWEITTSAGTFLDPIPQAITHGGEKIVPGPLPAPNGAFRRLNERVATDNNFSIHPGTHGFWIDVFLGGAGGGMASYGDYDSNPGQNGGSASLFMDDPAAILYSRKNFTTTDARADYALPIAFAEGGQGQGQSIKMNAVGGVAAIFQPRTSPPIDWHPDRPVKITIEPRLLRNGTSQQGGPAMQLFGGYVDPMDANHEVVGSAWRTVGTLGSGSGARLIVRIHFRRRAAEGNLPIKPLNLRMFANWTKPAPGYDVDIMGTVHYDGVQYEVKPPHSRYIDGHGAYVPLKKANEIAYIWTDTTGGRGGGGYAYGGMAAPRGSIGILDFGYYTSYA